MFQYLSQFRFATILNEHELEFRNIRKKSEICAIFTSKDPHIVMRRTDAQNGLDFHFKEH